VCLEIYKRHPEKWFLEHIFPTMLRQNRWFAEKRMTSEGYMCWGSDPFEPLHGHHRELNHNNEWQGAAFESGLDNSPMYDGIPFDTSRHIMLLADVGLMGLYIKDCKALVELAKITGNTQVVDELLERKELVEKALATMWDEDFGLFLNRHLESGEFSYRISPTNFYALFADSVTEEQKHRMVQEHFYNPQEFWGEWIMPAISRTDPAFGDQTYWRGRIWAPMNYLVYMAMKGAGLSAECQALAEKSEALILKEWRSHGHVHENYCPNTGEGCNVKNSDRFYHWGGLLAYIAIDHDENKA
jgi:hypothetical protein